MATENKKTVRQQLSKVTGSTISPARIRKFIDALGINKDIEDKLNKIKDEILKIKKEGGPQLPTPPETPKKDANEQQKNKYAELKKKYDTDLAKYNDFESEKHKRLELVYSLCKHLQKIHTLLLKEKRNLNQNKELSDLIQTVNDQIVQKADESEESFKLRKDKYEAPGYKTYLGDADLNDADSVQKLINELKRNNNINLFLQRDETSRSRIRFNDPAAVALAVAMELGIEELIEHGMEKTLESQKKTIQPDHCVSPGLEKCNWYVLFQNLPHLKAILDRQKRKAEYNNKRDEEKEKVIMKAKSKAKKDKKPYQRPKFNYPSFQETEVHNGFATKTETTTTDTDGKDVIKPHYQWYGIDLDGPTDDPMNDNTRFQFYVQQVCKKVINRRSEVGSSDFLEIKISTNIRKFFSDLIIDFIARISPQIRILINAMEVKTVDHKVVKTILKMILTDSYHSSTGVVKLNEEHEKLFELIDEKVGLCQAHQTGQVNKADTETDKLNEPEESDNTDEPLDNDKKGHTDDPTADIVKEKIKHHESETDEADLEEEPKINKTNGTNGTKEIKVLKQSLAKKISNKKTSNT